MGISNCSGCRYSMRIAPSPHHPHAIPTPSPHRPHSAPLRPTAIPPPYLHAARSLKTVSGRAKETMQTLNEPKYKHIDRDHRKKLIEYKTVQMTVVDLERYYSALDRALMKFHSQKMQDINKSIKELWNKTYKGSDIDSIEIHSEVPQRDPSPAGS